MKVDFCENWA